MPKLKTIYDTEDEIPEGLKDYYVERNGKFAPRHYDPENPEATIPIDPTRARKGGLKLKDETKNQ